MKKKEKSIFVMYLLMLAAFYFNRVPFSVINPRLTIYPYIVSLLNII